MNLPAIHALECRRERRRTRKTHPAAGRRPAHARRASRTRDTLRRALAEPATAAPTDADPARLARLRIEAGAPRQGRFGGLLRRPDVQPLRRGLIVGLVAVLAIAAVAGAIGLGVPGIRIVPRPVSSSIASAPGTSGAGSSGSPSPSRSGTAPSAPVGSASGLPGSSLGLGTPIEAGTAGAIAGIRIVLPQDAAIGPPASTWLLDRRVSFVWPASSALPPTGNPAIGLILSEFRGTLEPGYFEKILGPGTTIEPVRVRGTAGWWVSGAPHEFVYVDADGQPAFDSRRIVGDTLMWSDGTITFRLESGLDRAVAIALAESLR